MSVFYFLFSSSYPIQPVSYTHLDVYKRQELRGQNKYASLLDTCQRASIFFHNRDSVLLSARVNKGDNKNYSLGPSDGLQQIQVDGRIGSIRWTVDLSLIHICADAQY